MSLGLTLLVLLPLSVISEVTATYTGMTAPSVSQDGIIHW
jgi:hypothetical protein